MTEKTGAEVPGFYPVDHPVWTADQQTEQDVPGLPGPEDIAREDTLADADTKAAEEQAEAEYAAAEKAGKKGEMAETKKNNTPSKSVKVLKKSLMDDFGIRWSDRYQGDYSISSVIDSFVEDVQRTGKISKARTEQLFDALFDRGVVVQDADTYFQEIRKELKGSKIAVSLDRILSQNFVKKDAV